MLSNEELLKVNGGGVNTGIIAGVIGAIISFVVGIFDGYTNPLKCRK